MSPAHLSVAVLSTPSTIQLIEATCQAAAQDHLDDGLTTVGTHVCVSHLAAAAAGQEIVVRCRLQTIDRRRLTFEVTVEAPNGVISEGTHDQTVVDLSRFGSRA